MWNSVKEIKFAKEKLAKDKANQPPAAPPAQTTLFDETKYNQPITDSQQNKPANGVLTRKSADSEVTNGIAKIAPHVPGAPSQPSRPPLPTQESMEKFRRFSRGSSEDSSGPW